MREEVRITDTCEDLLSQRHRFTFSNGSYRFNNMFIILVWGITLAQSTSEMHYWILKMERHLIKCLLCNKQVLTFDINKNIRAHDGEHKHGDGQRAV